MLLTIYKQEQAFQILGRSIGENSVFLRCVTKTFEHSIILTQETTGHFMNSEIGNKLQEKKGKSVPCTTYSHI